MNQSGYYLFVLMAFFIGALVVMLTSYSKFNADMSFSYSTGSQQQIKNIRPAGTALQNDVETTPLMEDIDSGLTEDLSDLSEEMLDISEIEALESDLDDIEGDFDL